MIDDRLVVDGVGPASGESNCPVDVIDTLGCGRGVGFGGGAGGGDGGAWDFEPILLNACVANCVSFLAPLKFALCGEEGCITCVDEVDVGMDSTRDVSGESGHASEPFVRIVEISSDFFRRPAKARFSLEPLGTGVLMVLEAVEGEDVTRGAGADLL